MARLARRRCLGGTAPQGCGLGRSGSAAWATQGAHGGSGQQAKERLASLSSRIILLPGNQVGERWGGWPKAQHQCGASRSDKGSQRKQICTYGSKACLTSWRRARKRPCASPRAWSAQVQNAALWEGEGSELTWARCLLMQVPGRCTSSWQRRHCVQLVLGFSPACRHTGASQSSKRSDAGF